MVGYFSRGFSSCRSNFSKFRGYQGKFSFNAAGNAGKRKFHGKSHKPSGYAGFFDQQKATFERARMLAFPPQSSIACSLLLAKLELGGARLNSSSVSSGSGSSMDLSGSDSGDGALDPLISSGAIEEVLPTGMIHTQQEMFNTDSLQSAAEMLPSSDLIQSSQEILQAAEPTLTSLGLCHPTPVGIIQSLLEMLHVGVGLPWWAAIAGCTILFRTLILPLMIKGQINTARLNVIKPELERLQAKMRELANSQNTMEKSMAAMELQKLFKDNNCHPVKGLIVPLVQMPVFISFFIGLRKMANLPVESMQTGGLLWFTDLTAFDPYYILPVVVSLSMLATIELGTEMGISSDQMQKTKNLMRFMSLIMIPLTAKFPAGVFVYWLTSNFYSLGQISILQLPAVKKYLNFPDHVEHVIPEKQLKTGGFVENLKAGFKNAQAQAQIKFQEKEKLRKYKEELKRQSEKTYEYNPKIAQAEKLFKNPPRKR
eukprot:gene18593-20459_t